MPVKERPILFSGPMVRAILEGCKTQTRRVMNPQPEIREMELAFGPPLPFLAFKQRRSKSWWIWPNAAEQIVSDCPHGRPGDRLWVRESFHVLDMRPEILENPDPTPPRLGEVVPVSVTYMADDADREDFLSSEEWRPWMDNDQRLFRSSRFMPRWASRINLEIIEVRAQRVQEISVDDAVAEGIDWSGENPWPDEKFPKLWDSINGKRDGGKYAWAANPWVWALSFRRIECR